MYLKSNTTYDNFYIYTVNRIAAASTNSNKNAADIASYISSASYTLNHGPIKLTMY